MSALNPSFPLLMTSVSSPNQILHRFYLGPEHDAFLFIAFVSVALFAYILICAIFVAVGEAFLHLCELKRKQRPPPWKVCRRCGYNLIASRYRCPECGSPIPPWPAETPRIRTVRGFVGVQRNRKL